MGASLCRKSAAAEADPVPTADSVPTADPAPAADPAQTTLQPALTNQAAAVSTPLLVSSVGLSTDRQKEQSRSGSRCRFNKNHVRVLSGDPISLIFVGGVAQYKTYAQNPPKLLDSWEVAFDAEPGGYEIVFIGGKNPHHGILDVTVDSEEIGSIDQCTEQDEYRAEQSLYWECHAAGQHTLCGTVASKAPRSMNYWICLCEIIFRPVPRRSNFALQLQASRLPSGLEVKCTSMSGEEVAVLHCEEGHTVTQLRAVLQEAFPFAVLGLTSEAALLDPENDEATCGEALAKVCEGL